VNRNYQVWGMPEFKQTSACILAKTLPDTTGLGVIYTSLPENTMILAPPGIRTVEGGRSRSFSEVVLRLTFQAPGKPDIYMCY